MGAEAVGLLLVDKPEGPTSHDIAAIARRATGVRRVGHAGTLDPFASGLLLLCVGWATRLTEYLVPLPKLYRGVIRLGERTDTDDQTGKPIDRSDGWRDLDAAAIRRALGARVGEIEQTPPAFSAKKLSGRRAYDVARGGGTVDLRPQVVTIRRLELCDLSLPDLTVEVECSSGTYIRAIARDVGEELGVGGHLAVLRRLRIGPFDVGEAILLDRDTPCEEVRARLRPAAEAVVGLERVDLEPEAARSFCHGQPVSWRGRTIEGPAAAFSNGALVAIAELKEDRLWPRKVFGKIWSQG
ncbi:MAG: tRNA pseudouridine(55) synthase TruB [Gemmatimonadota bacterium]|nr:MAG: tRNA pseudouridine(55) synthase TruB [Gemmatimonadota bacterium]